MILEPTTLENHPAGGLVNAIISGNWSILNAIFDPANTSNRVIAMGLLKLDGTALSALADGKALVWNQGSQLVEARDYLTLTRLTLGSYTKLELVGDPGATPDPIDPTMPAADYPRTVVWCSDGDSGNPCLAASNGTDWKIIALGSSITP